MLVVERAQNSNYNRNLWTMTPHPDPSAFAETEIHLVLNWLDELELVVAAAA